MSTGLPGFLIVGLPDSAVQVAWERVRVTISNSRFKFPTKKVIMNLGPSNLRKEGTAIDLPIAVAILAVSGVVSAESLEAAVVVELFLDGGLRGVRDALSMAEGERREGIPRLVLPEVNAPEAVTIGESRSTE